MLIIKPTHMKSELKQLFNLPKELIIKGVKTKGKEVVISCRVKKRRLKCPHCSGQVSGYDHVTNRKRHTVVDGKTIYLDLEKRRFQCRKCQRVFTEQLESLGHRRATKHFIQLVQENVRNQDLSSTSRKLNVSPRTIGRFLDLLDTNKVHIP